MEQPPGHPGVAVTGMVDRHRRLNQTLVKAPVGPGRVVPEVFPNLVCVIKPSLIKQEQTLGQRVGHDHKSN